MGQILFAGGGGGAVGSDDLTATASQVLQGQTYMGNDTDDDIGTGTMPNIAAIDDGVSLAVSGDNLYCRMHNGAHIQNASPGYPEVSYNLATVRSAINYTDSSKVLNDTTICGMTGSMPSHWSGQHANSNGVNSAGIWFYIPYGYYYSEGGDQAWVYRTTSEMKDTVISAYGIASVTNFSVAQYSSQKLLFTWANPSWGMWSGIRIVGKQGGYPSNVGDGTVICDSAGNSYISGTLATGTWYFRAWNYVTVSEGRWYGGYVQGSCYNNSISGQVTFTAGGSWTVPTAVRQIQYFLVGAGGGAYIGSSSKHSRYSNGGGGGYTKTGYANVTPGQVIYITVGGGSYGGWGGSSSLSGAVSVTAGGGSPGTTNSGSGYGGSGGGGGSYGGNSYSGDGGSDGGSGGSASKSGNTPGGGQGSSTRCPWDSVLYAGGGGGGATYSSSGGAGGSGGGGAGGNYGSHGTFTDAQDGKANTGGGGGGVGHDNSNGAAESTMGGSGIVRIRW